MLDEKFMNKYRIASARAQWHEYNGGEYFVTICTHGREHYFGEISGGQMNLSEIGNYANAVIQKIPTHNHYAEIPLYVIMPNHIHLIVIIDGGTVPCRDVPWRVSTDRYYFASSFVFSLRCVESVRISPSSTLISTRMPSSISSTM